jgi:hypothetical protein
MVWHWYLFYVYLQCQETELKELCNVVAKVLIDHSLFCAKLRMVRENFIKLHHENFSFANSENRKVKMFKMFF